MQGIDEIIPVDVYVPGCPPSPEALIAAVMKIQERIQKGEQAKAPQGAHRLGAPGDGAIDRRAAPRRLGQGRRRARASRACRRAACSPLRVLPSEHGDEPTIMASATEDAARRLAGGRRSPPPASSSERARARRSLQVERLPRRPRDHRRPRAPGCEAATLLRDHPELDFKLFLDLCGVDYLDDDATTGALRGRPPRVLGHAQAPRPAEASAARDGRHASPTLTGVYKGANWFEREAWDLYGIVFDGPSRT